MSQAATGSPAELATYLRRKELSTRCSSSRQRCSARALPPPFPGHPTSPPAPLSLSLDLSTFLSAPCSPPLLRRAQTHGTLWRGFAVGPEVGIGPDVCKRRGKGGSVRDRNRKRDRGRRRKWARHSDGGRDTDRQSVGIAWRPRPRHLQGRALDSIRGKLLRRKTMN